METKVPLGYIELENGLKEIYAMNDLFLNFTFEKEENWEEFRLMVNILLEVMFISLTKLSKNKNLAGELALFLLGKLSTLNSEEMKRISRTFSAAFEAFKDDKEVKNVMTIEEKWRSESWLDGKEEGLAEGLEAGADKGVSAGASKIVELIKSGLSPDEALRKVNEERTVLVTSLVQSPA